MKKSLALAMTVIILTISLGGLFAYSQTATPLPPDAVYVSSPALPAAAHPSVSARSAILIEAISGEAIFVHNPDARLPMASTTKIMTAIVALSHACLDTIVTVPAAAVGVEGSSMYLFQGERVTMRTLLFALMLRSANDAATAIAIEVAGSVEGFAMLMNYTAARLGLSNTNFTNPHGLDHDDHYTTARELAIITAYAMGNSTFREIVSTKTYTVELMDKDGSRHFSNSNRLLRSYDGTVGVKTGFTRRSGRSLVSAVERDGMLLIGVTINAPNDWSDHRAMHDYGFARYQSLTLTTPHLLEREIPIVTGTKEYIRVSNLAGAHLFAPVGELNITQETSLREMRYAPVHAGEVVGQVRFSNNGELVATIDIVAMESVFVRSQPPTFWDRILGR